MPAPLAVVFNPAQKFSPDTSAFTRWNGMLNRFQTALAQREVYTTAWRQMVRGLAPLSADLRIRRVNETMNNRPYIPDIKRWNQKDYWATPGEFLRYGGDCEDYAIAKYLALRDLGHSDAAMRVVIVQDLVLRVPHAVLVVRNGAAAPVLLDNQIKIVKPVAETHRYRPIYSINRSGWWNHQGAGGTV